MRDPHDLRHTAASLAVSAGANVNAVQRMLGHASAAMTLDTYADLFVHDLDAVAVVLDTARSSRIVSMSVSTAPTPCASLLIAGGDAPTTVAGILGHKDATTTLRFYAHFYKELGIKAIDKLGELPI